MSFTACSHGRKTVSKEPTRARASRWVVTSPLAAMLRVSSTPRQHLLLARKKTVGGDAGEKVNEDGDDVT